MQSPVLHALPGLGRRQSCSVDEEQQPDRHLGGPPQHIGCCPSGRKYAGHTYRGEDRENEAVDVEPAQKLHAAHATTHSIIAIADEGYISYRDLR